MAADFPTVLLRRLLALSLRRLAAKSLLLDLGRILGCDESQVDVVAILKERRQWQRRRDDQQR